MKTEAQNEHRWLQQLVGDWIFESEPHAPEPGQAPQQFKGSETVRSLGGLWTLAEGRGDMPGGGVAHTVMTLGYDAQKKSFVGTWIGSMMDFLWLYQGSLDATGKVLTLSAEGPDFVTPGKTAKYRDVIDLKTPDQRVMTSYTQGEDGQWNRFMAVHYRRA